MLKRLQMIGLLVVLIMGAAGVAPARETVRVGLLPFAIYGEEQLAYLQMEIPQLIGRHLEIQGALIQGPEGLPLDYDSRAPHSPQQMRRLGNQLGVDFLVYGSLTAIGNHFSLDVRLINVLEALEVQALFSTGDGIQMLPGQVRDVARELELILFQKERVVAVRIRGNQRIESDAIQRVIQTRPGDIFLVPSLSEDLRAIYAMGYFDDIRIRSEDTPQGKVITFEVDEKPTIRNIRLTGNRAIKEEDLLAALTIRTGSIMNVFIVRNNIDRLAQLYKDKNYHNAQITYNIIDLDTNQADLELVIEEGKKIRIREIVFDGNAAYSDKQLRKVIKTRRKGFFSWITSSGELNRETLSQDVGLLLAHYQNNGYIQAKVGEPELLFEDQWIYVTFKIEEGPRFKVGQIQITGDILTSREDLQRQLRISKGDWYNRETLRTDILTLTDIYADQGYAYADVMPVLEEHQEMLEVDITYKIFRGTPVYFESIIIAGNIRTRDKVIRRELEVHEQELFSSSRLKRGVRNLYRLDYFDDVQVNTSRGSQEDTMILRVDVEEKPTGMLSLGGGYSSVENLFLIGSVAQRNLAGRGQTLELQAQIGSKTNRYDITFTEPWLFDIPLTATVGAYKRSRDYDTYDVDSLGGKVGLGYPVYRDTRIFLTYSYDVSTIENLRENASHFFRAMEGTNVTSSLATTLRYDTRDRLFNATEGSNHSLTIEYAGGLLGGDVGFVKYIGELGYYQPLVWRTVGFIRGRAGYVNKHSGWLLPPYERFFLGGINSLRGFDWRDLSPKDENRDNIGGDKFVQLNLELIFPLIQDAGIMGVVFFDTGDVYDNHQNIDLGDLRQSAGAGIRWYSPIGPIRLEYGHILNPIEGRGDGGRWEFTMGAAF